MENQQVTTNINKISWWKKNSFIIICFLSSLPLIGLGIWGIMFQYRPYSSWQLNNIIWIRWVALTLYIIIVEFVIVCLPVIMVNKKPKDENDLLHFQKQNLKKELRSNLLTYKIALHNAKTSKDNASIKQSHQKIIEAKRDYRTKLTTLNKTNKKNKGN